MLIIRKLNNEDLLRTLELLKAGRLALRNSYSDENDERYRKSVKYYKYKEALKIVSELFEHKWIGEQINLNITRLNKKELSLICFKALIFVYKRILSKNSHNEFTEGTLIFNNQAKIAVFEQMLNIKDEMDIKSELLLFDYNKNKMLFDREMDKLEQEINE